MKPFVSVMLLLALSIAIESSEDLNYRGKRNPLKLFNKCISDHECKPFEYCDHTGINPIGSCKEGKELDKTCVFDRHCRSKNCHLMKCVSRKPVKDGICTKDKHEECLPSQYCSGKENMVKCRDRKCSGMCLKDAHCISNKCSILRCKKPEPENTLCKA